MQDDSPEAQTGINALTPSRRIYCASWDEYVQKLRLEVTLGNPLYRGQRDIDWPLRSPWHRLKARIDGAAEAIDQSTFLGWVLHNLTPGKRDDFLRNFEYYMSELPEAETNYPDAEHVRWGLARHHGLISPLLDWTTSPYVAAFFAIADSLMAPILAALSGQEAGSLYQERPYVVWQFDWNQARLSVEPSELMVLDDNVLRRHSARIRAQRGVFTYLNRDEPPSDLIKFLQQKDLENSLKAYILPGNSIREAYSDLRRANIHFSSLFPDAGGAASEANLRTLSQSELDALVRLETRPTEASPES